MIKSTTALVRAIRDRGPVYGSLCRIDANKIHSGLSCDLLLIHQICEENNITHTRANGHIVLTFPAK